MAQECGRPGLSWVDWNGTRAPTHPVAEDSNVKSGRRLLLKEVPWTILPPSCFPKGNLSDTFGKIRKASTLPIKWVSQDVPTRILPLTERSHGVERMEGTAKARPLLFTACGEAVPRSPWVSVQPLPGRFHSRRLAATEGPSSWWLALTGPSFSLGLCQTSWFSINWLPFSLGKTPSVTLTHDSLLDLTSHSVSSPSQNKPYCLLNLVTMF